MLDISPSHISLPLFLFSTLSLSYISSFLLHSLSSLFLFLLSLPSFYLSPFLSHLSLSFPPNSLSQDFSPALSLSSTYFFLLFFAPLFLSLSISLATFSPLSLLSFCILTYLFLLSFYLSLFLSSHFLLSLFSSSHDSVLSFVATLSLSSPSLTFFSHSNPLRTYSF